MIRPASEITETITPTAIARLEGGETYAGPVWKSKAGAFVLFRNEPRLVAFNPDRQEWFEVKKVDF